MILGLVSILVKDVIMRQLLPQQGRLSTTKDDPISFSWETTLVLFKPYGNEQIPPLQPPQASTIRMVFHTL